MFSQEWQNLAHESIHAEYDLMSSAEKIFQAHREDTL